MRRLYTLFAVLWATTIAAAQTPVTPTQYLLWDHDGVNTGGFRLCVDTSPCTDIAGGATVRHVAIPAMTPGVHTLAVQACNADGCAASPALSVRMVVLPAEPSNLRIAPVPPAGGGGEPTMAGALVQATAIAHGTDPVALTVSAGNMLVVGVSRYQADIDISQLNTALGNTFTRVVHLQRNGSNDERVGIFVAENILGGSESVSFDASGNGTTLSMAEFSGALTSSSLDDTSTQSGSGAPDSGNATSSTNDAIAIGAFTHGDAAAAFAPGSGWTQIAEEEDNNTFQALGFIYRIVSSSGDYNANWTGSFNYAAGIAILKAAAAPGGLSIPVAMVGYRLRR